LSSFRLIDNFPDCFSFHLANYKDKEIKEAYLWKLNKSFENSLLDLNSVVIITDVSIKKKVAFLILHIHSNLNSIIKTVHYTINVMTIEAELFAIRYGINQAIQIPDISHIVVITDAIHSTRWIFNSLIYSYQLQSIVIA